MTNETLFYGVSFNPNDRSTRVFGRSELDRELKDPDVFSWIDIQGADIESLNEVLRLVGIDLVLVGHFHAPEVLPRIVERSDCLAFYLYEVVNPERHLDTSHGLTEIESARMILVLGADYVLTYHLRRIDAVEYVKSTCAENFRLAGKTPGFIAFLLMQRCLYDYAHLNLANDNYLDTLEAAAISGGQNLELAEQISASGANILTLKKMTASLHIVLMLIVSKRSPFISEEGRSSFEQMLQNVFSIRASIDSSRDLLDGVLRGMQAGAATRTSEIARVLTVLSSIVLPLTLIAGIYGMNFTHMPELSWRYGYYVVVGAMGTVALVMLLLFRKLGWLGRKPRKR